MALNNAGKKSQPGRRIGDAPKCPDPNPRPVCDSQQHYPDSGYFCPATANCNASSSRCSCATTAPSP